MHHETLDLTRSYTDIKVVYMISLGMQNYLLFILIRLHLLILSIRAETFLARVRDFNCL